MASLLSSFTLTAVLALAAGETAHRLIVHDLGLTSNAPVEHVKVEVEQVTDWLSPRWAVLITNLTTTSLPGGEAECLLSFMPKKQMSVGWHERILPGARQRIPVQTLEPAPISCYMPGDEPMGLGWWTALAKLGEPAHD